MSLIERLTGLRQRIAQACADCGRAASSVQLLAVSKQQSIASIRAARAQGLAMMGETTSAKPSQATAASSRGHRMALHRLLASQQKPRRRREFSPGCRASTACACAAPEPATPTPTTSFEHIITDQSLRRRQQSWLRARCHRRISRANSALGESTLARLDEHPRPSTPTPSASFVAVRELFDSVATQLPPERRDDWDTLSMGMSSDFAEAIRAGSTMLRVGSRSSVHARLGLGDTAAKFSIYLVVVPAGATTAAVILLLRPSR